MRKLPLVVAFLGLALRPIPASATTFLGAEEGRMVSMVNAARTAHGLQPLRVVDQLVELAHRQAAKIAAEDALTHNMHISADLRALGLATSWTGENAVVAPDLDTAQDAFLGSPLHLENMLRPGYNAIGIGVVPDPDGYLWVVQTYAEVKGWSAPAPPPPAPATPPPAPKPAASVAKPPAAKPAVKPALKPSPKPVVHSAIDNGVLTQPPAAKKTSGARSPMRDYLTAFGLICIGGVFALTPQLRGRRRRSITDEAPTGC
jgi:hypothetical protein